MTLKIKNKIMACERQYISSFSTISQEEGFFYFRDPSIPDMYYHNFIYVPKESGIEKAEKMINSRLRSLEGKGFCRVVFEEGYAASDIYKLRERLLCQMEIGHLGRYLLENNCVQSWRAREDCQISIQSTEADIKAAVEMDIMIDGKTLGTDFCTRRAQRMGRVYIDHPDMNNYMIYHEGRPIGSCVLFVWGRTAKVEDFMVIPEAQRKGFGTTLLKAVVLKALALGVELVFLNADEDDTAKEMYKKMGFSKIGENYDLLWADWMQKNA